MKKLLPLIAMMTSVLTISVFGQAAEKKVALKVPATNTYAGIAGGGTVNAKGKSITDKQAFTLADANGGELADGDVIEIKFLSAGGKTTYWSETATGIGRIYKSDATTKFTVKKTDAGISLKTASGKFVGGSSPIGVVDTVEQALIFEVVENPTVAAAPPREAKSPAATETAE